MIRAALAALLALFLSACATDDAFLKAQADAATAAANARVAEAEAAKEEARAVIALASKIDASGATAYLVAKAVKGAGASAPAPVAIQPPRSVLETAFSAVLQVADIGLRAYGIKAGRDTAIAATTANRDTAIASYGAFTTMGGHIATAGTAGYPYIQAPQPNQTIHGDGVIGAGTYTGPVTTTTTTTTRTCSGGTAGTGAAGGGMSGGGAGGSAPGGNC